MSDLQTAVKAHDKAVANLEAAKEQCGDACTDEAVHAPHRAKLEAAYADLVQASRDRAAAEAGI